MHEKKQLRSILVIIFVTGLIGGLGNFLFAQTELTKISDINVIHLLKSLVLGVIGAGIVPLIPGLVTGNLIDYNDTKPGVIYSRMVRFGSFCLLSSVFSTIILADTLDAVRGKYKKIEDQLEQQDQRLIATEKKSDSAQKLSSRATEKIDIAFVRNKEVEEAIKKTNSDVTRINEEIVAQIEEKEGLGKEEINVLNKVQSTSYLSLEDLFKNKSKNDSIKTRKIIEELKTKDLILETTILKDKVIISKAKWHGN